VDKDLVPRMSANNMGSTPYSEDANKLVHAFELPIPIPSYLLAIVVGNLVERQIDDSGRTFVVTEPTDIDRCVAEL
jgi:leukotriene-A4 hydrolase